MLPRRLSHDAPEAERRLWRVVRLDTHQELPGLILAADCDTGACTMKEGDAAKDYSLGPQGLAIVGR
jgi:hypothetical protein